MREEQERRWRGVAKKIASWEEMKREEGEERC